MMADMAITRAPQGLPPVHAESVRAGIRLAFMAQGLPMPPGEVVERIMVEGKRHLDMHEFPLELIPHQTHARRETRRAYAIKALEVLLQKSTDSFNGTDKDEETVDRAWEIAAQMERHDNSGLMLDVIAEKGKK